MDYILTFMDWARMSTEERWKLEELKREGKIKITQIGLVACRITVVEEPQKLPPLPDPPLGVS